MQGVYPDGAADAVFTDAAGGSGHGDGGSCVRRMAVFLYVAAGEADDAGADGGGLVRPAESNQKLGGSNGGTDNRRSRHWGAGAAAGGRYSAQLQAGQAESGTAHHRRRGLVEAAAVAAVFGLSPVFLLLLIKISTYYLVFRKFATYNIKEKFAFFTNCGII